MTESDRDLGRIEGRLGAVEERQDRDAEDAKADNADLRAEMRAGFASINARLDGVVAWQHGITGGKRALMAAAGLAVALLGAVLGYLKGHS